MLVQKNGDVQILTVGEHAKYKTVVFSHDVKIELTNEPTRLTATRKTKFDM